MITHTTVTDLPMKRFVSNSPRDRPLMEVVQEPMPFVKVTVEVQLGFRRVKIEATEECLASCNHDKHANAIRQSELAVYEAFQEFLKEKHAAPTN